MKELPKLSELNIIERNKIISVLRVEITYHSNRMEGITLDYEETKRLLEEGISANKPMSDNLIIIGFARAYDEISRNSNELTSSYIKDIHTLIFNEALRTCHDKVERPIGAYRQDERYIKGVDISLSSPRMIDNDLENLLYQPSPKTVEEIAQFHRKFEKIHPFADGNGRVGRLLMTKQFIENDLIPALIKDDFRKEYLEAINDKNKLSLFLKLAQRESFKLI